MVGRGTVAKLYFMGAVGGAEWNGTGILVFAASVDVDWNMLLQFSSLVHVFAIHYSSTVE